MSRKKRKHKNRGNSQQKFMTVAVNGRLLRVARPDTLGRMDILFYQHERDVWGLLDEAPDEMLSRSEYLLYADEEWEDRGPIREELHWSLDDEDYQDACQEDLTQQACIEAERQGYAGADDLERSG